MENDTDKIEKIILKHGSYVKGIGEEVTKGISQGVEEGVLDGLKRGVKDALQECLSKGFINIGQDDIKDILEDVPQELVKNSVREGARFIFEEGTKNYVQGLCQKLVDRIRKKDIRLSRDQTAYVVDLVKRSEQEAMNEVVQRLPNNTFLSEVVSGIQTAIEGSLENNLKECEGRIQKEIDNLERGNGRNGRSK